MLEVCSEVAALKQVLQWLEETCDDCLPSLLLRQLSIIVAEAFTNTVKYAHRDLPPHTPIFLELHLHRDQVEVRIWDRGQPFNLQDYLENELQGLAGEDCLQQEGQRGLLLMDCLTDDLYYETTPDRHRQLRQGYQNCLVMRKQISTPNLP